ncbi:hypothetical protein [Cetobacterium sp.]|uniref:hypothetical protein n=1 Tax=Cetobacterium sp. TaxID=2071632 RepID=UPI003EE4E094
MKDLDKLKLILEFLMLNDSVKATGEIEMLENEMLTKMESMKEIKITAQNMKELHIYLESAILSYKEMVQKKYFEYGVIASEYLERGEIETLSLDLNI